MSDDLWSTRAMPIMEAIVAIEEETDGDPNQLTLDNVSARAGLHHYVTRRTVEALIEDQLVTGTVIRAANAFSVDYLNLHLLPRGRKAIGQWPSEAGEALVLAVSRMIEREQDPKRKRALMGLLAAAKNVGIGVLTQLTLMATGLDS